MSAVSVTGNYSTSKGSVTVNGTKYTTCVKMESSTSVKVTVSGTQTVKFYFDGASKSFKVNGSSKTTSSSGTWSGTFTSGTMTITKGDSMNLYAIEISNSSNSLDADFGDETAIETVQAEENINPQSSKKVLVNGQFIILKDGKTFTLAGQEM
jgi:ribosomal protein L6P/L9E